MSKFKNIIAVVAMAENNLIGDGSGLVWHIPEDLKRVRTLTIGCPLIMGRKTWDSIGRPLPRRASVVMTRDINWSAPGAITASSFEEAVNKSTDWIAKTPDARSDIILFGGGEIYRQGIGYCNRIELTVVEGYPDVGPDAVYFPEIFTDEWQITFEKEILADGGVPAYKFQSAIRVKNLQLL